MTIEELMLPRWKVIADFPTYIEPTNCEIGNILTAFQVGKTDNDWFISLGSDWWERPKLYPAIFKKLEWWEERDEKDMPMFVKFIEFDNRSVMIPGIVGHIYNNSDDPDRDCRFIITEKRGIKFQLKKVIPATKEEYDNYQATNR